MNKIAKTRDDAWKIQEKYKGVPHGWIQWQGTDVCMDIHCKCGCLSHIDQDYLFCIMFTRQVMNEQEVITQIKEILKSNYPRIGDYHIRDIESLVKYCLKINSMDDTAYSISYGEEQQVDNFNDIKNFIENEMIKSEERHSYIWRDDEPKDEFEKGVMNVIRAIDFRIHCILDL